MLIIDDSFFVHTAFLHFFKGMSLRCCPGQKEATPVVLYTLPLPTVATLRTPTVVAILIHTAMVMSATLPTLTPTLIAAIHQITMAITIMDQGIITLVTANPK